MTPVRLVALIAVACGALLLPGRATACSCVLYKGTHQQQVQQALNTADFVFVAEIRHVKHFINEEYPDWPVTEEHAQFVILEVLKGRDEYFAGQPLLIHSKVAAGGCAISSRNDPVHVVEIQGEDEVPAAYSDTWLIYANGSEPFELSMCTRSSPLNFREPEEDLKLLRQLLDRVPPRRPAWEAAAAKPAPRTGAAVPRSDK